MDGPKIAGETPPGGFFRTEGGHFRWEPPPVEHIAHLLPGYEFISQVGRGGMGVVYLARQLALEREVAVKIMPPVTVTDDPTFVDCFRNEAKALARLNHPGIIQVYDFGETSEGHLYFIMEYVKGLDLHQILASTPQFRLPVPEAVSILRQACEALAFAHDQGIVHRDIKPPNLLITSDKKVKIADFGLAQRAFDGDALAAPSEVVIGTPGYSAPEIFEGRPDIDCRSDIFSLGMTAFEMMTGQLPRHSGQPPTQVVAELDLRVDAILLKATRTDRNDRFQSALEFSAALGVLLQPRQSSRLEPVSLGARFKKNLLPIFGGLTLLILFGYFGIRAFQLDRPAADPGTETTASGETASPPAPEPALAEPPRLLDSDASQATVTSPPIPTTTRPEETLSPSNPSPVASPTAVASVTPVASVPIPDPPLPATTAQAAVSAMPGPAPSLPVPPVAPTPPAPRPVPAELTALQRSFSENVANLATLPTREALDRLKAGFRSGLERALEDQRRLKASSPATSAFENDLKVLAAGEPLPPDTAATPATLLRLRGIYREHLAKIEEERIRNLLGLLTPHIGELIQLEQRFTTEGRGEDASLVRLHRETLAADPLGAP